MLRQEEDGHRRCPLQGAFERLLRTDAMVGDWVKQKEEEWRQELGIASRESSNGVFTGEMLTSELQAGRGLVKVNGRPLSLVQPEIIRFKVRNDHPTRRSPAPRLCAFTSSAGVSH